MDIDKVIYHLKEAERELSQVTSLEYCDFGYEHQSYLIAMSNVFDFVNSLKPVANKENVIRDDY